MYRCWQIAVGREVAVKVDNRVLLTERDRRRFLREVTAAGRLSGHPHVIDVYDAGTLGDGRPYLVMELCPAGSLSDALRRNGPMPAGQVRDIGVRLADALAAAHASGMLHRDIKPANILVNRFGMVGLADFGLASIISAHGDQTASREALTPAYSSPETFRGEEPTVLADVYSLAATLYALLSGLPPHFTPGEKAPGFATIMRLHGEPVQDVPGAPPELMALLRAAMSPDPAARPQSAAALRDALANPGPAPWRPGTAGPACHPAARARPPAPGPPPARSRGHRTGPPLSRWRPNHVGAAPPRRRGKDPGREVSAAGRADRRARRDHRRGRPGRRPVPRPGPGPALAPGPAPGQPRRHRGPVQRDGARRPPRRPSTGSRPPAPAARRRPSGGPWPGARRSRSASTGWS